MSNTVRPGNREKGWNDPPEFLHTENAELLNQTGYKRTILNQRVAHTFDGLNPVAKPTETTGHETLLAPPISAPPPISIPPVNDAAKAVQIDQAKSEQTVDLSLVSVDEIEKILNSQVEYLKEKAVAVKVCEDILKRVKMFTISWPKLSDKVKEKMYNLAKSLESSQYSQANDIHVRLMLDFPSEVSQWMVGIKKLIHELINLSSVVNDS